MPSLLIWGTWCCVICDIAGRLVHYYGCFILVHMNGHSSPWTLSHVSLLFVSGIMRYPWLKLYFFSIPYFSSYTCVIMHSRSLFLLEKCWLCLIMPSSLSMVYDKTSFLWYHDLTVLKVTSQPCALLLLWLLHHWWGMAYLAFNSQSYEVLQESDCMEMRLWMPFFLFSEDVLFALS